MNSKRLRLKVKAGNGEPWRKAQAKDSEKPWYNWENARILVGIQFKEGVSYKKG